MKDEEDDKPRISIDASLIVCTVYMILCNEFRMMRYNFHCTIVTGRIVFKISFKQKLFLTIHPFIFLCMRIIALEQSNVCNLKM